MNRIVFVGLLIVLGSHSFPAYLRGQTRSAVTFEVASVRINRDAQGRGTYVTTPGYVTATNYPVRMLILQAYGIADPVGFKFKLVGGPDRVLSQGVDLRAKLPEGADPQQIPSMLQALLAETFQLRIHSEVQKRPAYALRPVREGRLGPELSQSSINCVEVMASLRAEKKRTVDAPQPRDAKGRPICWNFLEDPPARGVRLRNAGPLAHLIRETQGFLDRPIIDETNLSGNFEWQLQWVFDDFALFSAFEDQLGLKLQPTSAPLEVFVIDSVQLPVPE